MTAIPFTKMAGTGNDFVVVDARTRRLDSLRGQWPRISRASCNRRTGVGADGVLLLERSRVAEVRMRVFNPDGSEAEMCGNGARCVALYQAHSTQHTAHITIETKAGILTATVRGGRVAMRMTDPTELATGLSLEVDHRPVALGFVNTGVPHAVVPVKEVETVDVDRIGRALRRHPHFAPRGTNVNFMEADPARPNRIRVRTYERGVEGETLACGTGVAASAVIHAVTHHSAGRNGGGRRRTIEVEAWSGDMLNVSFAIEPARQGVRVMDVVLEGAAQRIFDGVINWPLRSR